MRHRQYKWNVPTNHFQLAVVQRFKQRGMKKRLTSVFGDQAQKDTSVGKGAGRCGIGDISCSRQETPASTEHSDHASAWRKVEACALGRRLPPRCAPIELTVLKHYALAISNELGTSCVHRVVVVEERGFVAPQADFPSAYEAGPMFSSGQQHGAEAVQWSCEN
ncbi:hypothetical protein PybrP1_007268 [[Pythium] brassicae (nom. inval.)]|nr:hypothetical protein PybrP1_007268 [[Pythium] brassicae (nom. inval.)]